MQTVKEYALSLGSGSQQLQVPTGSTLLKAQLRVESEQLLVWFLVPNDGAANEARDFKVFKPEDEITDNLANLVYAGSYTSLSGEGSWHIFELI